MDGIAIALGMGLVISLLMTETVGLAAGGMIVPGYLAVVFNRPGLVILTLVAAVCTWGLGRLVSKWVIIYGRRRTALMLLVGFLVGSGCRAAIEAVAFAYEGQVGFDIPAEISVVGFVIPGLIAIGMDRQGLWETCCTVLTASALVRLTLVIFAFEVLI